MSSLKFDLNNDVEQELRERGKARSDSPSRGFTAGRKYLTSGSGRTSRSSAQVFPGDVRDRTPSSGTLPLLEIAIFITFAEALEDASKIHGFALVSTTMCAFVVLGLGSLPYTIWKTPDSVPRADEMIFSLILWCAAFATAFFFGFIYSGFDPAHRIKSEFANTCAP